jgi:predicted NBD/HSP70 family sugar kinase
MSTPHAVRHINETRALEAIRLKGSMSRADLARNLGITRSTASSTVASLMAAGMLIDETNGEKDKKTTVRTGRPSVNVKLNPNFASYIGIEIGVGRGSIAIVNFSGEVETIKEYKFNEQGCAPDEVAQLVANEVNHLLSNSEVITKPATGKISIAALKDNSGFLLRSPFLNWYNIPFLDIVRSALPEIKILGIENDADAFAVAEMHKSPHVNYDDAVFLLLDTGIGGCSVVNGSIVRGHNGLAGEIGHIIVGEKGISTAGNSVINGSLESFIGRRALFKRVKEFGGSATSVSELLLDADLDGKATDRALNEWARNFGRGLASIVGILAPEKIVISGPLAPVFGRVEHKCTLLRVHMFPNL